MDLYETFEVLPVRHVNLAYFTLCAPFRGNV